MKIVLLLLLIPVTVTAQSDLVIRHISVVNIQTGKIKTNQYVIIRNQKVATIQADNKNTKFPEKQVDGTGKF